MSHSGSLSGHERCSQSGRRCRDVLVLKPPQHWFKCLLDWASLEAVQDLLDLFRIKHKLTLFLPVRGRSFLPQRSFTVLHSKTPQQRQICLLFLSLRFLSWCLLIITDTADGAETAAIHHCWCIISAVIPPNTGQLNNLQLTSVDSSPAPLPPSFSLSLALMFLSDNHHLLCDWLGD